MTAAEEKIWKKALDFLTFRPHSRAELLKKLTDIFPEARESVLKTLDEMERVQLLNDRRFTEQFVAHLIAKPIGRLKIMVETRKKGLDPDAVESVLLGLEWSETESARRALEEKGRMLHEEDPRRRKQKLLNFLRNRGFKNGVIYALLK